MSQKGRFARRSRVQCLVFRYSLLLMALVFSASLLTSIIVEANDSDLDPRFDGDGVVTTDYSEFEQINDIAIQPDGKIVAVGDTGIFHTLAGANQPPDLSMIVARYNSDGSLDSTFGNAGIITADFGSNSSAMGVALQADGKIVVAGRGGDSVNFPELALLRYNADGSLDETFGFGGLAIWFFQDSSRLVDLAIQSDGKIVVTGEATVRRVGFRLGAMVARFNSDGSPDETFDDDGVSQKIHELPGAIQFSPHGIALQTDEKIVIAGVCVINSVNQSCLARYNSDGSLDPTFDGDGLVVTNFGMFFGAAQDDGLRDIAIQPDGQIIVTGVSFTDFGPLPTLARYNTDGSLDFNFAVGREVTFNVQLFSPTALALTPDGKIVIAGQAFDLLLGASMSVARYHSDGFPDDSFGNRGIATTPIGIQSAATAVAIQADGRIVAGGFGNFRVEGRDSLVVSSDLALLRYGAPINNPPVVTITGPESGSIFAVNTPVNFTSTVTDDPDDTHVVDWFFSSTTHPELIVVPGVSTSGSANTTYTFTEPGVYRVALMVTDNHFASTKAVTVNDLEALVVIYDPEGGWVAGGGWFDSPPGAYVLVPDATGKASFGFISKYQKGASIPTGATSFRFNAGDLSFQSTSYEWLVLSGKKVHYKGVGTINGSGSYQFMLTCIDGDQPGGGGQDKIRIRIWSDTTGLIYDNQLNFHEGADPTTVLGGGSIVIHQ